MCARVLEDFSSLERFAEAKFRGFPGRLIFGCECPAFRVAFPCWIGFLLRPMNVIMNTGNPFSP